MNQQLAAILPLETLQSGGAGPLYLKLRQSLEEAILSGKLNHGDALPPERDLADYANVSRVTVRSCAATVPAPSSSARFRASSSRSRA
jgi:GntR family transcriptional regulator